MSPGRAFRQALEQEKPLQIAGSINAYCALLAQQAGFKALYLSGAGVANASFGLPDLGMTTYNEICEEISRITAVTALPLLVDADTGWGDAFMVNRSTRAIERAGAAGCHIEDQVQSKRCGHRPNKKLVSSSEMCDRIKAACDSRLDHTFIVMARTDALAGEGLSAALERAQAYRMAGADMLFVEAVTRLDDYRRFAQTVEMPLLANITEFGQTPLFTTAQLHAAGVAMALYPLSAFRAMSQAAAKVYRTLRTTGTQQTVLELMQTREQLYQVLGYQAYENKLDALFTQEQDEGDI